MTAQIDMKMKLIGSIENTLAEQFLFLPDSDTWYTSSNGIFSEFVGMKKIKDHRLFDYIKGGLNANLADNELRIGNHQFDLEAKSIKFADLSQELLTGLDPNLKSQKHMYRTYNSTWVEGAGSTIVFAVKSTRDQIDYPFSRLLKIYPDSSKEAVILLDDAGRPDRMAIDVNAQYILSANTILHLWDQQSNNLLWSYDLEEFVPTVLLLEEGLAVVGTNGGKIILLDLVDTNELASLKIGDEKISHLFPKSGSEFFTIDENNDIHLLSIKENQQIEKTKILNLPGIIYGGTYNTYNDTLIISFSDKDAKINFYKLNF